jgi:hypothetical protein
MVKPSAMQAGTAMSNPHSRRPPGPGNPAGTSRLDDGECDQRADHHHFAVGEIDQPEDAVDHRVAERDQRVDAALDEAVDDLLEKMSILGRLTVT